MKISDPGTVIVENITPQLDGGRYPIKRAVGQDLVVEADIFKEGHDVVSALLKWRPVGDSTWLETPMEPLVNDRWRGVLTVTAPGPWEMTIEAWGDTFKSWQEEIHKKFDGGIRDLQSESLEGAAFVQEAATRAAGTPDADLLYAFATRLKTAGSGGNERDRGFRRTLRLDDRLGGPLAFDRLPSFVAPLGGWRARRLRGLV